MSRAKELGAEVREATTVSAIEKTSANNWKIDIGEQTIEARILVAADGRNSTVARLCNLLPRPARERIALQSHVPLPQDFGDRVVLQFLPEGYSGQAPVNDRELNLCLVGVPASISSLREMGGKKLWDRNRSSMAHDHAADPRRHFARARQSVSDRRRGARRRAIHRRRNLLRAARGRTCRDRHCQDRSRRRSTIDFAPIFAAHAAMYRGRLWINQLTRAAVLSPRFASFVLRAARFQPSILRLLTAKIVRPN